jgi:hypothetical protein
MIRTNTFSLLLAGSLTLLAGTVLAQDATKKPHVPLEKTGRSGQPAGSLSIASGGQL